MNPAVREKIKKQIWFHVEAIGATYGKDSLEPIIDTIADALAPLMLEEIDKVGVREILDKNLSVCITRRGLLKNESKRDIQPELFR